MAGHQHESIIVQDTGTMNNNIRKDHEHSNKKPVSNKQSKNSFTVFHQNICGLLNKKEELHNSLTVNSAQIICITEHHLIDEELEGTILWEANFVDGGTNVCVCVYIHSG
jgi:hypothetical protein